MAVASSDIVFPNLRDSVSKADNSNLMGKSWYKSLLQTKGAILQLNTDIETATTTLTAELEAAIATLTSAIEDGLAVASPVGTLRWSAASSVDTGWLNCTGAAVSRTTYSALFAAIGTAYGSGDGSTTFNLPNASSRFLVPTTLGATGGATTVTLSTSNLPPHTHTNTAYDTSTLNPAGYSALGTPAAVFSATGSTGSTGSGTAFSILPPYLGANLFIKY